MDELQSVVRNCPIIDQHGHNLLRTEYLKTQPFEAIATEAEGSALKDTFTSLPHIRAASQLRALYGCEANADWNAILQKRAELLRDDPDALQRRCLEGTFSVLLDDGLGVADKVHPYDWHDRLTEAPSKRILRIETVAEQIMADIIRNADERELHTEEFLVDTWALFTDRFEAEILDAVKDDEIVAFKSVVCYRTGLDVEPDYAECLLRIGKPFEHYVARCVRKRKYRIQRKAVNDYIVLKVLEIISEQAPRDKMAKPIQFHTGLGDADISLVRANPAYLQPLMEQYTNVPFVILHAAYPYTREAGYLATVLKNVYLDLGLVFPMLSRDGQVSVIRQSLELAPGAKLLYSSDGHWFPESYWLASRQFREALEEVLIDYVKKGDISSEQAISLATNMYFNNSNELYDLRYTIDPRKRVATGKILPWYKKQASASHSTRLDKFTGKHPGIKYVYVQWLDYMGTIRTRVLPIASFEHLVKTGGRIGISRGNTGTLQNDAITPAVKTTGQIYVEPDLASLRPCHKKDPLSGGMCFGFWRDESGHPVKECPRAGLQSLLNDLSLSHGINLLIGFEIEVVFLKRAPDASDEPYSTLTKTHAWGTLSPEQWLSMPLLAEIVNSLSEIGIHIEQFHAESALGQFEFVLPPLPPLESIDTLIQARLVIQQIAATHNLRATLHPSPFAGTGTAAHAHISLNPPHSEMQFFVGGVFKHLEAICAVTLPEAESYARVVDDHWSGGTWVSWGTQNRETPLRKVGNGRWEMRFIDGFANMYLAISAIVGAGLLGLMENAPLETLATDCPHNPSQLTPEQRAGYGIRDNMPKSLDEAVSALEEDSALRELLPPPFTIDYLAMKDVEQKMLAEMKERERRIWLIERY